MAANWETVVKQMALQLKIRVSTSFIRDKLVTLQNNPSAASITDIPTNLGINNVALVVEKLNVITLSICRFANKIAGKITVF